MSDDDRQKCQIGAIQEEPEGQFRDLPTSEENGPFISYFDTVLWIEDSLQAADEEWSKATAEGDRWDKPEKLIRVACENGAMEALAYRTFDGVKYELTRSQVPRDLWPDIQPDLTEGQPLADLNKHQDRSYGMAWFSSSLEEGRPKVALIGLCFRKLDVLKHWPEAHKPDKSIGQSVKLEKKRSPSLQVKTREVAANLWPKSNFPARVKDRDAAIIKWFVDNGQTPPGEKTIQRALSTPL
jgi:hypothetical protein